MTALNWILEKEKVSIATDTFSMTTQKTPFKYTNKIFPIPHLKMILCGTGNSNLIIDYFREILLKVVAREMQYVNTIAQTLLQELNKDTPKDLTSTIYHFGYNEVLKCIEGFAFRSKNNFMVEKLEYGIGNKPALVREFTEELYYSTDNDDNFFTLLINEQKRLDDLLPNEERVGIGGEIQRIVFDGNNYIQSTIFRFDDYLDKYKTMLKNLK
jgi:hypothetical protein